MPYNPFDKPIEELLASDLDILIRDQVSEGYWVEYTGLGFSPESTLPFVFGKGNG